MSAASDADRVRRPVSPRIGEAYVRLALYPGSLCNINVRRGVPFCLALRCFDADGSGHSDCKVTQRPDITRKEDGRGASAPGVAGATGNRAGCLGCLFALGCIARAEHPRLARYIRHIGCPGMMSVACGRPTHHQMAIYAEKSGGEAGCGGRRGGLRRAARRAAARARAPGGAGAGRCAPGGGLAALYGGAEEA